MVNKEDDIQARIVEISLRTDHMSICLWCGRELGRSLYQPVYCGASCFKAMLMRCGGFASLPKVRRV